jgi:uncharacterized protein
MKFERKGTMKGLKRYPLVVFFFLAFVLPWFVWGTTIAQDRGMLSFHIPQSLAFWIGLTSATYLAAALTGGVPAIKDLLSRLIRWRVNPIWYIAALTITGILSLLAIGIHLGLGGSVQIGESLSLKALAPSLLFQIFFFWLTEETAWRGFALPRLQAKYNAFTASLILGTLWGLWHIPLVFIPGSFQSTVPFIGFVLSAIATSVLMTWLFNHSKGSVLVAAVFHGATDAAIAFSGVLTGDLRLFWIFIILQWAAVAVIVITQGAAHLSRADESSNKLYLQDFRSL